MMSAPDPSLSLKDDGGGFKQSAKNVVFTSFVTTHAVILEGA